MRTFLLLLAVPVLVSGGILTAPADTEPPVSPEASDRREYPLPPGWLLWAPGADDTLDIFKPRPEAWTDSFVLSATWDRQDLDGFQRIGGHVTWRVWDLQWNEVFAFPEETPELGGTAPIYRDGLAIARTFVRSAGFPRIFRVIVYDLWSGGSAVYEDVPEDVDGRSLAWNEVAIDGEIVALFSEGPPVLPEAERQIEPAEIWIGPSQHFGYAILFNSTAEAVHELQESRDGGRTWEGVGTVIGTGELLSWPAARRARTALFRIGSR